MINLSELGKKLHSNSNYTLRQYTPEWCVSLLLAWKPSAGVGTPSLAPSEDNISSVPAWSILGRLALHYTRGRDLCHLFGCYFAPKTMGSHHLLWYHYATLFIMWQLGALRLYCIITTLGHYVTSFAGWMFSCDVFILARFLHEVY